MLILLNTTGKQEQSTNIMKYTFFSSYGWEEDDKSILDDFQNNRSLPDVSYLVICHKPGEWWDKKKESGRPYLRSRFFHYDNKLHWGPTFYDENGIEYETYITKLWWGQKLTEKQKFQLSVSFQKVLKHHSVGEVFRKVFLQPLRAPKQ